MRTLTSQVAAPLSAALHMVTGGPGVRRAWISDDRAQIRVRGVHLPGSEPAAEQIVDRLERLRGVRWAKINGAFGLVTIGHDPDLLGLADLVRAVEDAEESTDVAGDPFAEAAAIHPAGPARVAGSAIVLAANLAGLGYATTARLLPVPALPASVPAVLTTADSAPRIRGAIEAGIGRPATDLLLALTGAAANTLAQRPMSLLADAAYRLFLLREVQAAQRSWTRWDAEHGARPENHECEPLAVDSRPVAIPGGPVEHVGHGTALAGPALFAASLGLTGNLQRAQGFLVAGVPRAALVGRDAFASQLGHGLAERHALVLDPRSLRRLDRVDTVVIDASVLRTGRWIVQDVLPLDADADATELWERAHELVGAAGGAERGGWALSEVHRQARLPAEVREGITRGAKALALNRHSRLVALLLVEDELDPLTDDLLTAARAAGSVVLADRGTRLEARLDIDRVVPSGPELVSSVRELQREGRCVAVVSASGRAGLAAADIGIGVAGGDRPPWGAHLVTGPSLSESCALLRLIPTAHTVSRRSAQIALIGSASGAVLATLGPAVNSQARAAVPVAACAIIALAAGTWWGVEAIRRPPPRAVPRTPWHSMAPSTALELLGSSKDGLTESEVRRRILEREELPEYDRIGLIRASLEELASPLTPALAAGAGISAAIGAAADAALIIGVLGLNAVIGGVQKVNADRAVRKLLEVSAVTVGARREGEQLLVTADDLVPGDVVELAAGDAVPADCRVLETEGLEVDESSLTGESQLVTKTPVATPAAAVADRHCMLYQGTAVAAGQAVAVVVATGPSTEAGSAATAEDTAGRAGGVAARLQQLTKVTVPVCVGAGGVLLLADLLRAQPFGTALGRAVSLAVAAVPEGLPFVSTVAELAAARRLSQRGALVRNSATIEALGRADVLCFDKTGTLTEGRIALRGVSDGVAPMRSADDLSTVERRVLAGAVRASPLVENEDLLPHPTDRAVVEGARSVGVHPTEGRTDWQPIDEMPFEPSRGYHAVLGSSASGNLLSVKGAPEIVLAQCTHWRGQDGDTELDDAIRHRVDVEFDRLARQGFRVLAVAERPASDRSDLDESRIRDLRLVGLIALADPVRPTAAASVAQLHQAGVQIVMITGDHPSTAESIAAELNALNGRRVMTGPELDALGDDELAAVITDIAVFARVSPTQKGRIVQAWQRTGRVVAVTGDGANDAPAIRLADIGIALGERATAAAREAADVVVTDDRIETIVDALVEGRAMWASVRDSLALLLGGNLGEIGFTVITGLISPGGSINARQLLLVNLLTDVLPAMAIAVRPPPKITTAMLLAEGPEASLGTALTRDIYLRGTITAAAAISAWFLGRATGTRAHADTVALVALVGAQLGQTLVVRGRTPLVVLSAVLSFAALATVVQVPVLSFFFGSTPLWPHGWAIAVAATAAATAASMLVR